MNWANNTTAMNATQDKLLTDAMGPGSTLNPDATADEAPDVVDPKNQKDRSPKKKKRERRDSEEVKDIKMNPYEIYAVDDDGVSPINKGKKKKKKMKRKRYLSPKEGTSGNKDKDADDIFGVEK